MALVPEHEFHPHFGELPKSAGLPPIVQWGGFVGIIMIFIMGFLSFRFSGYNHVWPSEQTQRVPLTPGAVTGEGKVPNGQ